MIRFESLLMVAFVTLALHGTPVQNKTEKSVTRIVYIILHVLKLGEIKNKPHTQDFLKF